MDPETWEAAKLDEAQANLGVLPAILGAAGAITGGLAPVLVGQLFAGKERKAQRRAREAQERMAREQREHELRLASLAQERQAKLLKTGATIGAVGLGGLLLWKVIRAIARPRRKTVVA